MNNFFKGQQFLSNSCTHNAIFFWEKSLFLPLKKPENSGVPLWSLKSNYAELCKLCRLVDKKSCSCSVCHISSFHLFIWDIHQTLQFACTTDKWCNQKYAESQAVATMKMHCTRPGIKLGRSCCPLGSLMVKPYLESKLKMSHGFTPARIKDI